MPGKIKSSKLLWLLIVIVELAVIFITYFTYSSKNVVGINYTQDDFLYDTGENGFYLDKSYSYSYIKTPEFTLPKGWYTLNVDFEYANELTSRLEIFYADDSDSSSITDNIPLKGLNTISYDVWVGRSNKPVYVRARLSGDAGDGDYALLRNVSLTAASYNTGYFMFNIAAALLVVDGLLLLYCFRDKFCINKQVGIYVKVLIALIFISSIPLMTDSLFDMHDIEFHIMRIEGLKDGLQAGMFPVKIQPSWLDGHGYAVSVFYGDIFLYIPAILRMFGIPLQTVYKFYILFINAATVLISYYCFSKMGGSKTGLVCTIVYSLNIYRLCCIYLRGSIGEYTAMVFMPLLLYGLWQVYTLPEDSKEHRRSFIPIAFGCTGIFLSHIISAEITAFFVILTAVILWKKTFGKKTFLVLVKTVVITVCLNLWFLVPFLDYMLNGTYVINNPDSYKAYGIENSGAFLAQLFMVDYSVAGSSSAADSGIKPDMPLTLGFASMLVLLGWFLLCLGRKERNKAEKRTEYLAVFLCLLSLFMTLCLFPYTSIAKLIPLLKLPVRSFQFSWRFLTMAAVLLSYLLCLILQKDWINAKTKTLFAGLLIGLSLWQGLSYMNMALNYTDTVHIMQSGDANNAYVHGAEYIPIDIEKGPEEDYKSYYINQLTYDENALSVQDWYRDNYAVVVSLANNTGEIKQVEVPLLFYKSYCAISDTGDRLQISPGKAYRISVAVPADFIGSFRVEFKEPWYWRVCEILSLITLIGIIIYAMQDNLKMYSFLNIKVNAKEK
ncbi:MAG: hypothetical protein J1E98_10575 [Lachnospiraceae bacterium]|nr:hypothetical protein [Lachnospiraceae bacterium]